MWLWTNSCKHLCTKLLPANFYSWAKELSPFASASILFKCEQVMKEDHFVHSEIYVKKMECKMALMVKNRQPVKSCLLPLQKRDNSHYIEISYILSLVNQSYITIFQRWRSGIVLRNSHIYLVMRPNYHNHFWWLYDYDYLPLWIFTHIFWDQHILHSVHQIVGTWYSWVSPFEEWPGCPQSMLEWQLL